MPASTAKRAKGTKAKRTAGAKSAAPKATQSPASSTKGSLPHTLAEVSRAAGVSATTIKYYLKGLPGLIEFSGEGRARRFSNTALDTLVDVRRMLDAGQSLAEVRAKLSTGSPAKAKKAAAVAPAKSAPAAPAKGRAAGAGRKSKKSAPAAAKSTTPAASKAAASAVSLDAVMGELKEIRAILAKLAKAKR